MVAVSSCPVPESTRRRVPAVSRSAWHCLPERVAAGKKGLCFDWCRVVWGKRVGGRPGPWCASFPCAFPVLCFFFPLAYHRSGGLLLESHLEFLLGRRRMFGLLTYQSGQLSQSEEASGRLLPAVCRSRLPPSLVRRRTLRASWASAGVTIWKAWGARSEAVLR